MKKIIALALSMALCFSCIACDSKGKDNANNSNKKETTERDNENSKDKNVKDTKKDDVQNTEASEKENTVASSNNEESNNNVDKSSNNNTDTSSENLDSKNTSATDSYEDVTKDNKDKITGTWKDKNSNDIYIFGDDESYSYKSDTLIQDGQYWFMNNNNQLYLFIYAKGTAHPSNYIVNYKDDNTVELIDPTDSSNVLTLLKQ